MVVVVVCVEVGTVAASFDAIAIAVAKVFSPPFMRCATLIDDDDDDDGGTEE